jgi:hypothetical protein
MIRNLAQVVVFAAWFVVLFNYQPLRGLIRRTPRSLSIPFGLVTAAWLLVQVTHQPARFFPFISVFMYGEHTPAPSLRGIALRGTWCDGSQDRLDPPFMGRLRMRSRLQALYEGLAYRRTAADSARRLDLLDRTLISIGTIYNRRFADHPLCSIGLDEIIVPARDYESGRLPPPRVVRDVPLR